MPPFFSVRRRQRRRLKSDVIAPLKAGKDGTVEGGTKVSSTGPAAYLGLLLAVGTAASTELIGELLPGRPVNVRLLRCSIL